LARIAGIDLPRNKRIEIALTYIYGIGRTKSQEILKKAGVDFSAIDQDAHREAGVLEVHRHERRDAGLVLDDENLLGIRLSHGSYRVDGATSSGCSPRKMLRNSVGQGWNGPSSSENVPPSSGRTGSADREVRGAHRHGGLPPSPLRTASMLI